MMNSNEHIHKPDSGETELSDLLPDNRLQDALKSAYPDPKGKIAGAVMAQIRAEREAEAKQQIRAARTEARRRRRGLFMKWGGMAACMVILCGVLVIASPLMNRAEEAAVLGANGTVTADAAVCDAADAEAGAEAYSDDAVPEEAVMTFSYTAEATEEAAVTKSAPLKKAAEVEEEPAADADNGAMMYAAQPMKMTMTMDAALEETYETAAEKEAYLQTLIDGGVLTWDQYEAWMTANVYTTVDDWTCDELYAAFGENA